MPCQPLPCLPPPVPADILETGPYFSCPICLPFLPSQFQHLLDLSPLRSPNTSFSGQQGPISPHPGASLSPHVTGPLSSAALGSARLSSFLSTSLLPHLFLRLHGSTVLHASFGVSKAMLLALPATCEAESEKPVCLSQPGQL